MQADRLCSDFCHHVEGPSLDEREHTAILYLSMWTWVVSRLCLDEGDTLVPIMPATFGTYSVLGTPSRRAECHEGMLYFTDADLFAQSNAFADLDVFDGSSESQDESRSRSSKPIEHVVYGQSNIHIHSTQVRLLRRKWRLITTKRSRLLKQILYL